jgi:RimJ/RimL family protein N-acetyltransferase
MELIPLTEEHLEFLLEVRNHESTRKFLENDTIFDIGQCKNWFLTLDSPWYIIIIDNQPVGYIRTNGNEIGCDIHPNHRKKGYAKMAYLKLMKNMSDATLWVFDDNFAKELYLKIGFKPTGDKKFVRGRAYINMQYEK